MRPHKGVALITALLVTAIATIAAVSMLSRQHLDIRRSSNILSADQAWLFSRGLEDWAVQLMHQDQNDNQIDHNGEDWATILPPIAVEGGLVAGNIEDLTGRFNLNNLLNSDGEPSQPDIELLRRLLNVLAIDSIHVDAIVDWLDKNQEMTFPDGAEDNVYLNRQVAYRTADSPMVSPSELLLIEGVNYEDFLILQPYLSALPERTSINVNTAAAVMLQAVVDGLESGDAEQLVSEREDTPYNTVDEFTNHTLVKPHDSSNGQNTNKVDLAVSSQYFLLNSNASFGRAEIQLASVIARSDNDVRVIQHGQGGF